MAGRTAQRRARASAAPKAAPQNGASPEEPQLVGEVAAEPVPNEQQPPGVAVIRQPTPDGGQDIQIITLGGMDALAVPTLLEFAIKVHKEKLGLSERK